MSATTGVCETRIKRCAVCKIDLKGRFVYIDDEIQLLFGYSLEELFAQPFTSFLVESDHQIIEHFLLKHKHYESKYETTRVHIVNRAGRVIPASIIVSLSFAGGNPVNFQILIDTDDSDDAFQDTSNSCAAEDSILSVLGSIEDANGLAAMLPSLKTFIGDVQIAIYRIGDEKLELTASTYSDVEVPPETAEIHQKAATTGEIYSAVDQDAVRQAIETGSAAPNECFAKVLFADGSENLLRVIFGTEGEESVLTAVARRATAAVQFLRAVSGEPVRTGSEPTTSGTIGDADLLGELDVATAVVERSGSIAQISGNTKPAFGTLDVGHSWQDIIAGFSPSNDASVVKKLESLMRSFFKEGGRLRISERLVLHDGATATLVVRSIQDGEQIIFASIPNRVTGREAVDLSLVGAIVAAAGSSVDTAAQSGNELGHRYFNNVDDDGNFQLLCLQDSLSRASLDLDTATRLLSRLEMTTKPGPTDLNLVLSKVHEKMGTRYPQMTINIQYGDLPKIESHSEELGQIVEELIAVLIPLASSETVNIAVTANVENGRCEIRVSPSELTPSRQFIGQLKAMFSEAPSEAVRRIETLGSQIFLCGCLLDSVGGNVEFDSSNEDKLSLVILLPSEATNGGGEQ